MGGEPRHQRCRGCDVPPQSCVLRVASCGCDSCELINLNPVNVSNRKDVSQSQQNAMPLETYEREEPTYTTTCKHGKPENWHWQCRICKERFSTKETLSRHHQGLNQCGDERLKQAFERANPECYLGTHIPKSKELLLKEAKEKEKKKKEAEEEKARNQRLRKILGLGYNNYF